MGKAKGLSFAEKQERLLNAMRANNECYIFKEVEAMAKKSGIIPQATKDVLQSLLDDDLVQQDRIGSQNVYWSLAIDAGLNLQKTIDKISKVEEDAKQELENLTRKLKELQANDKQKNRKNQEADSAAELSELEKKLAKINEQIELYNKNSPEKLEAMEKEIEKANQSILRWEDNICVVRQWIKNRCGVSEKSINAQFGISEESDEENECAGCNEYIEAY